MMIEPYCFHCLTRANRFRPGFYVFGIEEAVKVKRLKIEVQERHGGGRYRSRGGAPIAIHKEMLSPGCGTANLRKVVQ